MSWEAHRWTAKTPSELLHTFGPHGVNDLVRQSLNAVWRDMPEDVRTFDAARRVAREVFDRNINVWRRIKQPTPEDFFADLQPHQADQYMRQAMVTCWMMMPRAGGRRVADAVAIVTDIFERNMAAWQEDNDAFTKGRAKSKSKGKAKPAAKTAAKKSGPKKPGKAGKAAATKKSTAARRR